jgi:hypothetical protein
VLESVETFLAAARGKFTTYFALGLSGLAMLPDLLPQYWSQIEGLLPTTANTERVHHLLLGIGALAVIYLRVRREVKQ